MTNISTRRPTRTNPNWFVGFPVDGAFLASLPPPPRAVRLYHPDDVHLTLAFLGACGEEAARRSWGLLERAELAAAEISLGSVVPMGSARSYSALSALLERGRTELEASLGRLRDPLTEAASGRRERRPPQPHVTLARAQRMASDAERAAGIEWAAGLDLGGVSARLNRVALYTWTEIRRPRLFRIVEELELSG